MSPDGYSCRKQRRNGKKNVYREKENSLEPQRRTFCDFENELMKQLDECEELIDEHDREVGDKKEKRSRNY